MKSEDYLSSVASRTIRRAFWLLSSNLHLWELKRVWISDSAARNCRNCDLNCALQYSQIPSEGKSYLTIRRFRLLAMPTVYAVNADIQRPVEIKRHHYLPAWKRRIVRRASSPRANDRLLDA